MNLLELKNVSYSYTNEYQSVNALNNVSYTFKQGNVYIMAGKSGSGKSTLLSLLAGLDVPQDGQVLFKEQPTTNINLNNYRRTKVAVIYQNFLLFPLLTILENIMYPMELCGIKEKEAKVRAKELAKKVALPEALYNRFPSMISGGEQQRVAIARALSMDRKIILADEPTGNLDSENGNNIMDILVKLANKDNYCVIIATHDKEIIGNAGIVVNVKDGRIL